MVAMLVEKLVEKSVDDSVVELVDLKVLQKADSKVNLLVVKLADLLDSK